MFLPDRFIKGECPNCHSKDQYGDSCEVCGTTYSPTDLTSPTRWSPARSRYAELRSLLLQALAPERCEEFLGQWTQEGDHLQEESRNKMREWFDQGLHDWDISRDAPYFGFEIPGAPGKYFYVWLDAPIGYLGSFRNLRRSREGSRLRRLHARPVHDTEMVHFIGKDILYFHALFWPAMLQFAGYRSADQRLRARLPDRRRAEDVEVARHVHHRGELSGAGPQSGVAALLLRGEARADHGGPGPQSSTISSRG